MYIIKEGIRLLFLFDYIRQLGKVRIQEIKFVVWCNFYYC